MLSGCAVLPDLGSLWVDAHFGSGTSLDDLLVTLRTLSCSRAVKYGAIASNWADRLDESAHENKRTRFGSRGVKQQGGRTRDREANEHLKASPGTVLSLDFATMKLHSPLRDGQPQADTAGGTFS